MHRPRLRTRALHLARRFFGSLSPRPLNPADDAWVLDHLIPAEADLWRQMSRADRKHAAGVARIVDERLGGADRAIVAAAALHDVGKIDAGYGTFRRAGVTAAASVVGRTRLVAHGGRPSRYLTHDLIGADLLTRAGSDPLTIAWAREHHLAPPAWTLRSDVADALAAADDD